MDGGDLFWIIASSISAIILIVAYIYSKKNKDNPDTSKYMCRLIHRIGIEGYPSGIEIWIVGYINKIEINYTKNKKNQKMIINTKDIINISTFYEWQEQDNSQIKNAVIGGVIAGGAGAIVGSNLKKTKNKEYRFVSIKYLDEEKNEKALVFKGLGFNLTDNHADYFVRLYKKYVPYATEIITEIE